MSDQGRYIGQVQQSAKPPDGLARRILWGLVIGVVLGLIARIAMASGPGWDTAIRWFSRELLDPFGQVFLRLLFFVVVPLVLLSLAIFTATRLPLNHHSHARLNRVLTARRNNEELSSELQAEADELKKLLIG